MSAPEQKEAPKEPTNKEIIQKYNGNSRRSF